MKIAVYGVRDAECPYFHSLNTYRYKLTLIPELLHDDNVSLLENHDCVILRGNCKADRINLQKMKARGIRYLLTRTVGFDHIDLDAVRELGFLLCACVPTYSPNAVSELAVSLALGMIRKSFAIVSHTQLRDFRVQDSYFAREIRNCMIGIIGMGQIGEASAKAFLGMGAEVLGHDPIAKSSIVPLVDKDVLLRKSDIVLLHCPYMKGHNHHMVDECFLSMMKNDAVLINTARGELVNLHAVVQALESGKLSGVALDVLEDEKEYFFRMHDTVSDPILEKLISLYPKVIITPHIGSFTDEAVSNMIETSYRNLQEFLNTGSCRNNLL